jgi:hypothetical protein
MAQGCGEHWKGEVCVEHCDRCREMGLKTHLWAPVPDFLKEHPEAALEFSARCPVHDPKSEPFRPAGLFTPTLTSDEYPSLSASP